MLTSTAFSLIRVLSKQAEDAYDIHSMNLLSLLSIEVESLGDENSTIHMENDQADKTIEALCKEIKAKQEKADRIQLNTLTDSHLEAEKLVSEVSKVKELNDKLSAICDVNRMYLKEIVELKGQLESSDEHETELLLVIDKKDKELSEANETTKIDGHDIHWWKDAADIRAIDCDVLRAKCAGRT